MGVRVRIALGAVAAALLAPGSASAANSVYWNWATFSGSNVSGAGISFAGLSGSGGGALTTGGHPLGVAIDAAAGRIYWANYPNTSTFACTAGSGGNTISFENLGGGSVGNVPTGSATVNGPDGVAIDPAAGRIYWANELGNKISYANLNGSGGADIVTGAATVSCPAGVAVDPAIGKIFWANQTANKISYANLNGTGGGDLSTGSASVNGPYGVAIDPVAGRIYWTNTGNNTVSYAALSGLSGADLNTGLATVNVPDGVAIDPAAGRIYWANNGATSTANEISYANLNGSGGADLPTPGASAPASNSKFPALLETPVAATAPGISGGSSAGATLSCSNGSWAPDLVESFLYRAPQSFVYAWTRNGSLISGASSSTITATSAGSYVCYVTAVNHAGSATQPSAAHAVSGGSGGGPSASISGSKINSKKHTAKFTFTATGASGFQCALVKKKKHKKPKPQFSSCSSPKTYKHLKKGKYIFEVRGVGGQAATKSFKI